MRRFALFMALAALLLGVRAPLAQDDSRPETAEAEPNDDPEAEGLQRVGPGATLRGEISAEQDQDWFAFEALQDCVCDVAIAVQAGQSISFMLPGSPGGYEYTGEDGRFEKLALRLGKGLHTFGVRGGYYREPVPYTLRFTAVTVAADEETEPDDNDEHALLLEMGKARKGMRSSHGEDRDFYAADIAKAGIYRLAFNLRTERQENRATGNLIVSSAAARNDLTSENSYRYYCDQPVRDYVFYPVLQPGRHLIEVQLPYGLIRDAYEILLELVLPKLTPDDEKRARAAIERGVGYLNGSLEKRRAYSYGVAVEGAVLAALCDEPDFGKRKAGLEQDFVTFFAGLVETDEFSIYQSEKAWRLGGIYDHAFATIALAEAAAKGSDAARQLCESCVKHILGAQLGPKRDAVCGGPVAVDSPHYGGWRYYVNSQDSDLSITGWCLVALVAADTAGIKLEGTRAAVQDAQAFIERCSDPETGYTYQPGSSQSGNIRNSIGALTLMLLGADQEDSRVAKALADLDRHLPAGTQVDVGPGECFYYWYYATRVNYLRAGQAWENWRALMVEQLLRRQQADGSWDTHEDSEAVAGPRYASAIAVIILRLCLNQAPKYLRPEGRGF